MLKKRNVLLPVGLLSLIGMLLLGIAVWGNTPAAAHSSVGDLGANALHGKSINVASLKSSGSLLSKADKLGAAGRVKTDQTGGGSGLTGGINLGGLPSSTVRRATAQGALDDILTAVDDTSAVSSYDFKIDVTDPISGPESAEGQYVADNMVHLQATDQEKSQIESIIVGDNIYTRESEDAKWDLKTRDDISNDPRAAAQLVGSFADTPNVFESIGGLMSTAANVEDEGEVQLSGATTRHYTFELDGAAFQAVPTDEDLVYGTGEIFVDLSSSRVYALNYDIDFEKFISVLFGSIGGDTTPTATPEVEPTAAPVVHLVYNLRLDNFEAIASFAEPSDEDINAATPEATEAPTHAATAAATATRTARTTRTAAPRNTPTPVPTDTPQAGIPADVDQMIGDSLDQLQYNRNSYHFDLTAGDDDITTDGVETNTNLTLSADVENPDKVSMNYTQQTSEDGVNSVAKVKLIRIGDDVYENSKQTNSKWKKYSIDDYSDGTFYTLVDVRSVVSDAAMGDDEDYNGVTAHHITFTFDLQKIFGEDTDLSAYDQEGGGEMWIDADTGDLLELKYYYSVEDPDSGAKVASSWDGVYSNFDKTFNIKPPSNVQQ